MFVRSTRDFFRRLKDKGSSLRRTMDPCSKLQSLCIGQCDGHDRSNGKPHKHEILVISTGSLKGAPSPSVPQLPRAVVSHEG